MKKTITISEKKYEIEPYEVDSSFAETLDSISDMSSSSCQNCPLSHLPVNKDFVRPSGYPRARIMFVGMNPSNKRCSTTVFGGEDDRHKEIVNKMLAAVKLTRDNIYVTNILKCSTSDNKFDKSLASVCAHKLIDEIAIVDPELIICLGKDVSEMFGIGLKSEVVNNGNYLVGSAYHPSYFLRGNDGAENNLKHMDMVINGIIRKDFVNLHVHNEFSIRDGIGTAEEHVLWALKHKSPAVALTNHGNISVFFKQYEACKAVGIKPIFGAELYIIPSREKLMPWIRSEVEGAVEKRQEFGGPRHHILVLAKNYTGLRNLFKITSLAYIESFYKFPLVDFNLLAENKEGIIISTACAGGELNKYLANDQMDEAKAYIEKYKNEFGDDFYIEMMSMDYDHQWMLNKKLWDIAKEMNVKTIVTTDAHYLYPEDQKVHEAILLLQSKKSYKNGNGKPEELEEEEVLENENEKLWEFTVKDLYLKTFDQILKDFKDKKWFGDAIFVGTEAVTAIYCCTKNTYELFTKIENFELDKTVKIPSLYENSAQILYDKIAQGLMKRINTIIYSKGKESLLIPRDKIPEYKARCRREYDIIVKMDFVNYFLILEDMISWTKEKFGEYSVGPGRGSAGGSLVNYLTGITDIDPIKHNLLFERFLDEGRKDLPDVDIDFRPDVRDAVKQYLIDKYGNDKVATICNYQVAKVKSSIKDAARIYNLDFAEVNRVTNALPYFIYMGDKKDVIDNMGYDWLVEKYKDLYAFLNKYPDVDRLFRRLRNSIKAIGRHAAGLVVSDVTLYDWIPLVRTGDHIVTANTEGGDYHELTGQGFVKFDILGLNNLAVVTDTMRLISSRYNVEIDWDAIDVEAPEAYALARRGDLLGVFQFESGLAGRVTVDVQPTCFDDLSAINALIRPGPLDMGMEKEFARRKKSGDWHVHKSYSDLLKSTYGIIVYQEDFMRIFREIGKFNPIEVNKARKDLVKYERSTKHETARLKRVDSWKEKFVTEAEKVMGIEEAEKLWNHIRAFARYGFNKSHADAYTITSFRELWLKAHYGIEFYTALLNNTFRAKEDKYGTSSIAKYISHVQTSPVYYERDGKFAKRDRVRILPVDVNKSGIDFEIEENDIRFGLTFVKGVTLDAAKEIITNRPFKSIDDFIKSDNKSLKNKRIIIALIKSGALDSIAGTETRASLYNRLIAERKYKEDPVAWDIPEIIENEIDVMNISFTEVDYFSKLKESIAAKFGDKLKLNALEDVVDMENGNQVNCFFRINKIDKKKTKSKKTYYVFSVTDGISMMSRIYYWAHKEEDPINCSDKKIKNNVYMGTINRQNNFYGVKKLKFVRSIC
jgi:DNA polymerase-3 subunit alpha